MALKTTLMALMGAVTFGAAAHAAPAPAPLAAGAHVDDFRLADQEYLARRLYKMSDAKAVVLYAYVAGDPAVKADAAALMAMKAAYAAKGVEFLAVDSRSGETRARVIPDAKAIGLSIPILFDYEQLVGEGLHLTRAGEVIIVDPKGWTVAYRGAAGAQVSQALDGLVAGQKVALAGPAAKGAAIAYPALAKGAFDKISYVNEIAPIVKQKCATCHQPGGIGPMPLNTYEQVKGFAPMIREVIRTQRMPPYLLDETVGHFQDDDRLSPAQIKSMVHWIEGGAPRGKGEDPLAKIAFKAPDWPLGKPDVIVDVPAVKIPATGVMDYQRPVVKSVLSEGRWMKATTFRVSDRQVVHHILTGVVAGDVKPGQEASEQQWGASLGGYGPGRGSNIEPVDTGVWVPPSGGIGFQNHYTPYGKPTEEKTQMGIYFYPKGQEPKYVLRTFGIFDFSIVIPAGEEWHHEQAYVDFPHEAVIYGITPHAHHRGSSATVTFKYPDGREEMVLALPRYDFSWQYEYMLAKPMKIPAGTRAITRWTFDNSSRNPDNPDYKREIRWGEQSSEEMLALYFHYRWTDETVAHQLPKYDQEMQKGLMMGVMDDSMDGKLQPAELKGNMGDNLKKYFTLIDQDHDGAISQKELDQATAYLGRMGGGGRRPNNNPAQKPPEPAQPVAATTAAAAPAGGGR
jgi:mono/diheme cytochrome c family protein